MPITFYIAIYGISVHEVGATKPEKYNSLEPKRGYMSLSLEDDCPECDASNFYKAASMRIQLGTKKKWHCANCEYGFITINGINTSA